MQLWFKKYRNIFESTLCNKLIELFFKKEFYIWLAKKNKCYFIKYRQPFKAGKNNYLVTYIDSYISCFDKDGNEITNKNFTNAEVLKIYNEYGIDVTKEYMDKILEVSALCGEVPNWFVREIKTLI